jgi:Zn-dependent protease with chaperone function
VFKFFFTLVCLLIAPALGLFASTHGMKELLQFNELGSIEEVALACPSNDPDPTEGCSMFNTLHLLYRGSLVAFIITFALPIVYLVAALLLGRSRDLLAHWFPPLVKVCLGILPLMLIAHGVLIWVASWELFQMGIIPGNIKILAAIALIGGALVLAAISIISDLRRLLTLDPLHATGLVLEKQEMPELFARVARIAQRLGSREPARIVIGIEPTAYVANTPMLLRGVGELPTAETLYLPTTALRVLDDAELDALIGHELGHFRGKDLEFSSRFAPAFRSMSQAAESISSDGEDQNGLMQLALMPALGLLSFMMFTLGKIVSRIGREREFAADQAALEVSNPRAIASLLVKFSVLSAQWPYFHYGVSALLHQGTSRRNFSRDYLVRTRQFMAALKPQEMREFLTEAHTPHPLDSHPSLADRAAAVGMDPSGVIESTLLALRTDRPVSPALETIEERITMIDTDYYRHPSSPVTVVDDPELPPELRFVRAES